jgi:hypothetical protein
MTRFLVLLATLTLILVALGCPDGDDDSGDDDADDDIGDDTGDDSGDDSSDDDSGDDSGDDTTDDDTGSADCEAGHEYGAPPAIVRGPFLQQVTRESVVVRWDTDRPANSVVRYGPEGGARDRTWCDFTATTHHEAQVWGLSAGARYEYVVRSDGAESAAYAFRAAAGPGEAFSFVAYGDNQDNPDIHEAVATAALATEPDIYLNTGDVVSDGLVFEQWDERFFGPAFELMARTPFYVSIGNHENQSPYYFDLLSLPGNEHWYSVRIGDALLIALDTNKLYLPGSDQYAWLVHELSKARDAGVEWIILFNHQPAWCEGWGGPTYDGEFLERFVLVPLYEQYGVDLVLNGHAHDYERGQLNGVTYIIDGGGGGGLDTKQWEVDWITVYEATHHFVHGEVDGTSMHLTAIRPDGSVVDDFTIQH